MTPYFSVIFLSLVSHFIPKQRNSKMWYRMYLCILCVFLCFGYMCGSDWRQYEPMYNDIDFNDIYYGYYAEPGFLLYMTIFRFLHVDFWIFSILNKIIQFSIISYFIYKYASEYKYIVWMFLLAKSGFYMFIDYPMRNMIAIAIFLLSTKYIIRQKFINYLICAIMAMMFHISAVITIPLYFILNKNISKHAYIISFIIVFSLFSLRDVTETVLINMTGFSPYILQKVEYYIIGDSIYGEGSIFSLGMFLQILFFAGLLKFRSSIICNKYGVIILNGSLIYILLYRLGLTIGIFSRFQLYLVIFYAIGVVQLIKIFTRSSRHFAILLLCFLSCFTAYKDILSQGWKYVPYSNYLSYVLSGNRPNFDYRSNYNINNTPYKESIRYDDISY